jgi:hypothetical protein
LSGPHMSPVFLPYTCINMQCKNTFMKLWNMRRWMMVFLYFSASTVNISYEVFTLHKSYLHGA